MAEYDSMTGQSGRTTETGKLWNDGEKRTALGYTYKNYSKLRPWLKKRKWSSVLPYHWNIPPYKGYIGKVAVQFFEY
jgi:O-methyltransferase involved in polyketide biosynthesis